MVAKEFKSYRVALTDGLPMNNSIGKPYRPDSPSSLNAPLESQSPHVLSGP